jgi:hypothetical protein
MKAEDIMTTRVITVTENQTKQEAASRRWGRGPPRLSAPPVRLPATAASRSPGGHGTRAALLVL